MKGYVSNLEKLTTDNKNFREVLFTAPHTQLVLMSLKPKEDVGMEIHPDVDQFIRIEAGKGQVILDGEKHTLLSGYAVVIPAGTEHDVINTSDTEPLKLYSVYGPPNHKAGTIHETKADAEADENDKPSRG